MKKTVFLVMAILCFSFNAFAQSGTGFMSAPAFDSGWISMPSGDTVDVPHNVGGSADDYFIYVSYKKWDGSLITYKSELDSVWLGDIDSSNLKIYTNRYITTVYSALRIRIWKINSSSSSVEQRLAAAEQRLTAVEQVLANCSCAPEPTVVSISSIKATPKDSKVSIDWKTESEIDNAGFNVWRAEGFEKMNKNLIPAQGSPTEGSDYEFLDESVLNRKNYLYLLEDIDVNGVSTLHGPIKATPRWIYGK